MLPVQHAPKPLVTWCCPGPCQPGVPYSPGQLALLNNNSHSNLCIRTPTLAGIVSTISHNLPTPTLQRRGFHLSVLTVRLREVRGLASGHAGDGGPRTVSTQSSGTKPSESLPLCTSLPVCPLGAAPPLPTKTPGPGDVRVAPGSHGRGGMRTRGHLLLPFQHHGWLRRGPGTTVLPGSPGAIWDGLCPADAGGGLTSLC